MLAVKAKPRKSPRLFNATHLHSCRLGQKAGHLGEISHMLVLLTVRQKSSRQNLLPVDICTIHPSDLLTLTLSLVLLKEDCLYCKTTSFLELSDHLNLPLPPRIKASHGERRKYF